MRVPNRLTFAIILLPLLVGLGTGCAAKPKTPSPADEAAIREPLHRFSGAWGAADPAALRESFHIQSGEAADFVDALGALRVARQALLDEQNNVEPRAGLAVFGFKEFGLSAGPPYLHEYARGAANPGKMLQLKDIAVAELTGEHRLRLRLFRYDGAWKIDPSSLADGEPLGPATDRLRRQTNFTNDYVAAIRARDTARANSVVQRMAQQELVDRISQAARKEPPAGPEYEL